MTPQMKQDSSDPKPVPVLSIVIPVYNEVATIGLVLLEVVGALPRVPKQIIIVDDCSTDGTSQWLRRNLGHAEGVWRGVSLNPDGELNLSAEDLQNNATF